MFHQIVYASSSTCPAPEIEVDAIVRKARRNNRGLDITGMLVSLDRTFFQVLEGPEPAVRMLYEKISLDPRHRRVLLLLDRSIPERRFGAWQMAWADMPKSHPLASEIVRFTNEANLSKDIGAFDPQVLTLMKTFIRNNAPQDI